MDDSSNKVSLKFWIGTLALSVLLVATTFALLASYLADIKSNTMLAVERADVVAQRLDTLDVEVAKIQRRLMEQRTAQTSAMAAPAAAEAPASVGPPAIQPPAMAAPAVITPPKP